MHTPCKTSETSGRVVGNPSATPDANDRFLLARDSLGIARDAGLPNPRVADRA